MKKALKTIRVLFAFFLILGPMQSWKTDTIAALISTVIGVFLLFVPLFLQKRKKVPTQKEDTIEYHVITKENVNKFSHNSGMFDYEYSDCGIYRPDSVNLPMPPIGAALRFALDPENEYDDKAIKAVWEARTVGWLYRKGKREMIRDWIKRGDYYEAEVSENDPELKFWIGMDKG